MAKHFDSSKIPVKINPELDKLAGRVFFPEKLKEANRIIKEVALPKIKTR